MLALQNNKNIIRGHFLTNVLLKALPAGITDVLAVGAFVMFAKVFKLDFTDVSTACTILMAIIGCMMLFKVSRPMTRLSRMTCISCIAGLILCGIFLNNLFALTKMSEQCILLLVIFAIATEPVLRYVSMLTEQSRLLFIKFKKEIKEKLGKML